MERRDGVSLIDRDLGTGPVLVVGLIATVVATVCGVIGAESSLLASAVLWAGLSVGLGLVIALVNRPRLPPIRDSPRDHWYGPPMTDLPAQAGPPDPPSPPPPKRPPYPMHNYQPPPHREPTAFTAPMGEVQSVDDHVRTVLRELRQLCKELNARVDELEGWTPLMEMRQKYVDQVCADADLLTTKDKGLCR